MGYDPLTADLPQTSQDYPDTYWRATAGNPPTVDAPVNGVIDTDIAIIGAGYTGLSCAYYLARKYGIRVHVLEAHQPGWGCSGRNGSLIRPAIGRMWWWECIKRYGPVRAKQIFQEAMAALNTMRELIADGNIDCDKQADGWLRVAHHPSRLGILNRERRALREAFGYDVNLLDRASLHEYGHAGAQAYGALHYPDAFSAHPLKLLFGLVQMARGAGAVIHGQSPVVDWQKRGSDHELVTPQGQVRARHVVIATNGYSTEKLHPSLKARLMPVLSSIIVTRPLSVLELVQAGFTTTDIATDTRKLLSFYRLLPDGRILLGSRGAITESGPAEARISRILLQTLKQKFPSLDNLSVDYHWSGWVALSMDSMPRVHSPQDQFGVSYAIGYNGSGTTASVHAGRLLADKLGDGKPIPDILDSPLPRFPFASFRRLGQRVAFMAYQIRDAN